MAAGVGLEQLRRLLHEPAITRDHAEAAALVDVELRVVEAIDMQHRAVDEHHLPVISGQVVRGARDRDAALEQAQLELAEILLAASIGVRDERTNDDAAADRRVERLLDLHPVESKNDDVDRLAGLLDGLYDRLHAIVGLNDELHFAFAFFSDHSTAACPFGSSARIWFVTPSRSASSGTWTS